MASEMSTREAYGHALVELGKENENIVVLDADLSRSTMTRSFAAQFPERFFDCGIAEQNMMGIAAGLAASGKTVFASTFAVFASGRCYDQVRMSIAQPHQNVKIVATHSGVTVGEDGFSHHSIEDLALFCSFPGFTVVVPADAIETTQAVRTAANTYGPFYIRLSRPKTPLVYADNYRFVLGKAVTMRGGQDATVIACGLMVDKALQAVDDLAREGIECRVVNMPTLKPLDEDAIIRAAEETGAILTVEEHLQHGGLGSRVSQVVAKRHPVPMSFLAIKDFYSSSGKAEELLEVHGLTVEGIQEEVRSLVGRKG
ncbi:MAG: transketolase family protein [Dehalococcoidia bacterium]|jgi:transketolase|nr:transketolase family protein [Chloroflexota bacterium]MCK4242005.1 transketolase family protein [Dehalococcoidia bacterium]